MHKLVIFDCDGVLVDSEIIANRIDSQFLTELGYPISPEESIRRFTGVNAKDVRRIIFEESGIELPKEYSRMVREKIVQIFEAGLDFLIKPVLDFLKENNIARSVASSSHRDRVIRSLELTEQIQYFTEQSIFTSQQVTNGKPSPDLFLFAAKEMDFEPKECIVIEDSRSGIEAAISAKMDVIAFLGGSHAQFDWYHEKIRAYNVPIANSQDELLQMLKRMLYLI